MADSNKRQAAELVRINYRKQLARTGEGLAFTAPTIVGKIDDDADGLMPISKIRAPLEVTIPLWPNRPDDAFFKDTLYLDWRPVTLPETKFQSFANEVVPDSGTLPDTKFPLDRTIPLHIFDNFEGKFEFRYRVKPWNTPTEADSDPAPVTIDRTGPIRPGVPDPIIVSAPLVTTEILERDGGLICEIPDFIEDKKAFVTLAVALFDVPPTEEPDPAELAYLGALPDDRLILIPKGLIYELSSRYQYIVYFLFDKAGNRSDMPFPAKVQVALGDLPDALKSPEVPLAKDDLLIDRADAAFPTTVRIKEYDNWLADDGIIIQWGLNALARTSVGAHLPFPLDITVPWLHLKAEYDFDRGGKQPTDVDYQVFRGDYYLLQLALNDVQIPIKHVEFEAAKSMVQWESRQYDEDVCSFTGYAFARSSVLNFDPLLYARMPESIRPEKEVARGKECPPGQFLISLHRCEYWPFDLGCEPDYTSGLNLIIHDVNGNRHRVRINFKTPGNRNSLMATKY